MATHYMHLNFTFAYDMQEMVLSKTKTQTHNIQLFFVQRHELDSSLLDALSSVDIEVVHAIIFATQPNAHLFPHSDRAGAKINIVYGESGSRMFWWKSSAEPEYFLTKVKTSYWRVPLNTCKLVESTEIGTTLVDSDAIHSVMNNTKLPRYALSLNLRDKEGKMIPFQEASARLKKFAK